MIFFFILAKAKEATIKYFISFQKKKKRLMLSLIIVYSEQYDNQKDYQHISSKKN